MDTEKDPGMIQLELLLLLARRERPRLRAVGVRINHVLDVQVDGFALGK